RCREERPRGEKDQLRARRREGERVGARRALEVAEAEAKDDRPADAPCGPQPPADAVDDGDERCVDRRRRVAPAPERALRADRSSAAAARDATETAVGT